jgi:hypothetical protein
VELENWVNSIHSACAAAFARHRGKTGTLHLLQEEIFRLDKAIDSVCVCVCVVCVCVHGLVINVCNLHKRLNGSTPRRLALARLLLPDDDDDGASRKHTHKHRIFIRLQHKQFFKLPLAAVTRQSSAS